MKDFLLFDMLTRPGTAFVKNIITDYGVKTQIIPVPYTFHVKVVKNTRGRSYIKTGPFSLYVKS